MVWCAAVLVFSSKALQARSEPRPRKRAVGVQAITASDEQAAAVVAWASTAADERRCVG